ncbi:uncharacterized protein BDZ99DRAFT_117238 [Mytilinidion resinicola]|uniref:Uncharacterized protein n=1 Tax=Mytilinidion resinicola TaxID=574789 RepID=A0A6A6Y9J6_9PEZI|nr:uncharacterized protein BDZ99DRAFT_117238 [Mytilinidion resinicola]KAF2805299.1 hypothetical protein BDZ99DRAFT_117238 [Mytilinidion resinicola]
MDSWLDWPARYTLLVLYRAPERGQHGDYCSLREAPEAACVGLAAGGCCWLRCAAALPITNVGWTWEVRRCTALQVGVMAGAVSGRFGAVSIQFHSCSGYRVHPRGQRLGIRTSSRLSLAAVQTTNEAFTLRLPSSPAPERDSDPPSRLR